MGYLDESQYLGDAPQGPMQLPDELAQQLAGHLSADPGTEILPPDLIRLPGGIVMKKTTAVILGVALVIALIWWYANRKKKR